jgi:hypothetical protein
MLKIIQTFITLFILASLILQILVILGNFSGLRSVNIVQVDISNSSSSILGSIIGSIEGTIDSSMPDFFTVALFVICEGSTSSTTCSPPSFGFRYSK